MIILDQNEMRNYVHMKNRAKKDRKKKEEEEKKKFEEEQKKLLNI